MYIYIITGRCVDSQKSQNQLKFLFFTLLGRIAFVNTAVTVLYLLRALHRRIIVYRVLYKIQNLEVQKRVYLRWNVKLNDIARPIYVDKTSAVYYLGRRG